MSRKTVALFLATTGLITSLAGCGAGQDAHEKGGEDPKAGQTLPSKDGMPTDAVDGDKREEGGEGDAGNHRGKPDHGDKTDEGGEGGEGGEG